MSSVLHRRVFALAISAATLAVGCDAGAANDEPRSRIDWRWRHVQAWEYGATALALGAGFYLRFGAEHPDPDWRGGVLFDDWVREHSAVDAADNRRLVTSFSDAMFYGAMGYRLVDSVIVPGVFWGNPETALQMSMIDLEAFGFVAITLWGSQAIFGRERPEVDRCDEPEFRESEGNCEPDAAERNRSFYAGHPAVSMTAAGLTCTHHAKLPLYGGSEADTIACGVTVGAAVANGFGRVLTEKHYASDLAVGLGVGAFAGWVLPRVLHYGHERPRPATMSSSRPPALALRVVVLPLVNDDGLGVSIRGEL
jgi:membrane-associated phospholipid phosphatase